MKSLEKGLHSIVDGLTSVQNAIASIEQMSDEEIKKVMEEIKITNINDVVQTGYELGCTVDALMRKLQVRLRRTYHGKN